MLTIVLGIAIGIIILALLGVLLHWLLITTEGVYLGRKTVIYLYDLYASRYDRVKEYHPTYEQHFLARPLLQAIAPNDAPLVLDVATGTARLPIALLRNPQFEGRIVAVDLSRRMLHHAVHTIAEPIYYGHAYLMHAPAENLPFPDNTFDVVTCLEAIEFMISPRTVIRELIRVLRPGGLLLVTNRRGQVVKLMPGKTWTREQAQEIYEKEMGLVDVRIQTWQVDYDLIWAYKAGNTPATRKRPLSEFWLCPRCGKPGMIEQHYTLWVCEHCGQEVKAARDGVIEVYAAMRGQRSRVN